MHRTRDYRRTKEQKAKQRRRALWKQKWSDWEPKPSQLLTHRFSMKCKCSHCEGGRAQYRNRNNISLNQALGAYDEAYERLA